MREITFTCDDWMGAFLDKRAEEAGSTRSEAIRQIISQQMIAQMMLDVATREARRMMKEEEQ